MMSSPLKRPAGLPAFLGLFIFLGTLMGPLDAARAAENIEIPNEGVKVYLKSDIASALIGTLHAGSIVPAATNPVGNFRKVMITVGGVKKIGYINLFDIKGELKVVTSLPAPTPASRLAPGPTSPLKPLNSPAPFVQAQSRRVVRRINYGLHNRAALDLVLGIEYQNQGPRIYTDGSGGQDQAGSLSGSQPIFGLGFIIPVKYTFSIEPYILYKNISVTGTLTPTGPATNAASGFILSQTYLSVGALAKFYSSVSSAFWYGGGLQLDHALSGSFQIGSQNPVASQQGDLPNLILIYGAVGLDLPITRNFFIMPNFRAGALVNTSPPIFDVTGNLSLVKGF